MTTILLRGGSASQWTTANPVLMAREVGVELNSTGSKMKIGDGFTPWNDLPYFSGTGGGGGSATALADLSDVLVTSYAAGRILQSDGTQFVSVGIDTDGTLAADSDLILSSQKAVKTYTDTAVASVAGYDSTFGFASPVTTWTLSHGQGTKALSVECFNDSGQRMIGEIEYVDNNTITVSWYYPTSGSARVFS